MGNFQYKSGSNWVDVPDAAKPDDSGSILVVYPEAAARDGQANPCGVVGQPKIVIKVGKMTGTGMAFWNALFASAMALTASLSLTAFDARTGTWKRYTGTLQRPTFDNVRAGASAARTWYRDGTITIENILEVA